MSRVILDSDHLVNRLLNFLDNVKKLVFSSHPHKASGEIKGRASIPVDILETPKEYVFYFDVPGLSKSDIQVNSSSPIPMFLLCPNRKKELRLSTSEVRGGKLLEFEMLIGTIHLGLRSSSN
ncbi:uncharacterized protein J3R85_000125 [Psidium guajava]|nr:uncharacterized protein J3R85_000125 [Psidium guajava]